MTNMNVDAYINEVSDPAMRRAIRAVFQQLVADMQANKDAFDNHTHYDGSAFTSLPATDAAGNSNGSRATFQFSFLN